MKKLGLHEIRREFLDYFEEKGHLVVPSFSLIPKNDKSLLLIGAGMAPLKKYFTGEMTPPKNRMATCQKCIRTGDIENVGKTDRHATFFEMLGNFSFGDYFKKESIEFAWDFLTKRLEIDPELLWASVYYEDLEAAKIWNEHIGMDKDKIVPLGKADNFWELEVGPSGPCSEIYIDRGEKYGCGSKDCKPGCECDRFIEVWNLVFTQFDKDANGVYHPLEHPNIDTGMGLERITAFLENADNIFEIEEIRKIIQKIEEISDYKYGTDPSKDVSIRVITDHVRAMTFLVSDGVLPSNEGRGYVLRRLIRRASRHGKLLGIRGTFLTEVVGVFIDSWMVEYKELKSREDHIKRIILSEEDKFQETIDAGIQILESYIEDMKSNKEDMLSGEKSFKLYDTYGFPLDLTLEILEERHLKLDEDEFKKQMEDQRTRARSARNDGDSGWGASINLEIFDGVVSEFKGYEYILTESKVLALTKGEEKVDSLSKGEEGMLVLNKTPFYAESGGQVGDTGIIANDRCKIEVIDTKHNKVGITIHMVKVIDGTINIGESVTAQVDEERRDSIRRNHSATHLLHKALKEVLGEHVNQAGSIVDQNRLRFDYTHFESPTSEELNLIEKIVNKEIYRGIDVTTTETSLEEAQKLGVVGLFEEKYGDVVRVIRMGEFSKELCGGTHVTSTSNIGMFKIISEGGIASGVRRIEAITGLGVYDYLNEKEEEIDHLSSILKTNKTNLIDKTQSIVSELKAQEKEVSELKMKLSGDLSKEILEGAVKVGDVSLVAYKLDNMDIDDMRNLGDKIKDRLDSGVVVLASVVEGKITFLVMVTKDLIAKGVLAGNIVREVAKITGGNGGGRPNIAQAGGKDVSKLDEAFAKLSELILASKKD